jgi:hypothetical protein
MTPREHYSALLKRITTWATEEECGKGKTPTTQAETDAIAERLVYATARAKMFHVEPERHQKQSWFLKAKAPTVIAISGNKFGKTFALLLKGLIASLGCCPWDPDQTDLYNPVFMQGKDPDTGARFTYEPPLRIGLVVQDFATSLPEDIIVRLKEIMPWDALVTRVSRVQGQIIDGFELFNGSTWRILSHVQEDERFEGWSMHAVLWNEPMPRAKYIGAMRGSMEFNATHLMAMTPISEPWLYDSLYLKSHVVNSQQDFDQIALTHPEIVSVEGSTYDNPFLPREAVDRFERTIPDSQREARLFGKFTHLAGLVYKTFSREQHVRELATLV